MPYAVAVAVAALILFNALATLKSARDECSTSSQKAMQVIFIWFIPIIGGLLVYSLTRNQTEIASGKYHADKQNIDDGMWLTGNSSHRLDDVYSADPGSGDTGGSD